MQVSFLLILIMCVVSYGQIRAGAGIQEKDKFLELGLQTSRVSSSSLGLQVISVVELRENSSEEFTLLNSSISVFYGDVYKIGLMYRNSLLLLYEVDGEAVDIESWTTSNRWYLTLQAQQYKVLLGKHIHFLVEIPISDTFVVIPAISTDKTIRVDVNINL